ncbi:ribonuclease H-like domain-containing protein [Tanacetum coccineum]
MVTRAKAQNFKTSARNECHDTTTSAYSSQLHLHALRDPNWHKAMVDEYNALISNGTWALVPRPANVNIVRSMWFFKHKFNADGSLSRIAYLPIFVDNHTTQPSTALLQRIITLLHSEFAMTDLGSLNYFLGVSAQRSKSGLFLSQSKFAEEILERAHMQHCNPCKTPVDTESKLSSDGDPVNISYAVQQICLYMHDPRDPHFTALKRILRYVRGTIDHGLQLYVSSTSQLTAYTDADWAGCPVTRRSTSGYCVFLGDNLLSWSAKRRYTCLILVLMQNIEVLRMLLLRRVMRNLLIELHTPLFTATLVYCDNVSAVYLSTNPVQHQRTKHIEIDIHFVREYVASGQVRVLHVPSRF